MTLRDPGNYVIALLVETMAEEFPRESYECNVVTRARCSHCGRPSWNVNVEIRTHTHTHQDVHVAWVWRHWPGPTRSQLQLQYHTESEVWTGERSISRGRKLLASSYYVRRYSSVDGRHSDQSCVIKDSAGYLDVRRLSGKCDVEAVM